ncbi:serine hydrolase [Pedobacter sp.]|nr:serine hydrolase [Candidatus Saccharibacteria bacterium]
MNTKRRQALPATADPIENVRGWWHKPHWQLSLGIIFLLVATVALQCFYPYGRSAPNARIGDLSVANLSRPQIIAKLHDTYGSVPLTVAIPGAPSMKTTSVVAGVVPNYQSVAERATDYPLSERLLPFSFIAKLLAAEVSIDYQVESELFAAFAQQVAAVCDRPPSDASIAFAGGKASLVSAADGQRCSPELTKRALLQLQLKSNGSTMTVMPERQSAVRSDSDMRAQLVVANATISKGLSIGTPAETWEVSAEDIASWLTVGETDGVLQTKPELIRAYLEKQTGKLYIEPGVTAVRIIDGVEISRTTGVNGQGIDPVTTEARISEVLLGKTTTRTAWAQLTVLPSREVIAREFTPTHQGLQALVTQWDKEHNGRYGIIVRDLTTKGWAAELLPNYDFVTASTYKMFLAYAVLHKVESGELTMDATTDIGLSVRACIDEMILHSTNACATSLFNLAGWGYVHNFILGQFPSTRLDNGQNADNEKHTTVFDEVTFMHRLYAGQLMTAGNTDYLLNLFKHQIYRKGIPAGVPGVTVADKIGFYAGYKHDVGIVYAPSGTYILGIMSYGGSDTEFADLSAKVYALMRQR